jgi:signal transduction histidine kinase
MERGGRMSLLHDKHNRWYCIFIVVLIPLLFLISLTVIDTQTAAAKEMFLTHDNAIATSLLEEGVSKEVIATALMNTDAGTTGNKFLAEIGLSNNTDIENLPYVSDVKNSTLTSLFVMLLLWTLLLFLGTMLFLYRRERLYRKSENIIKDYIDGNYTVHLPQSNEGNIYQLLASVDQLATMLQAKNDTEQKTKEFLKNTISDISHQLKTPLSALMMYQEIIENEPDNPETVREFSFKIGTALKRIEQLIQSMLKITRIDAGSIYFEKSNYSIPNILNYAINELTTRADNEKKEIVINGDLEQMLYCDIEWTGEAIGNIVKNALDHTDSGGKIAISCERTPAMIRILITDNGHGIAGEDIHHIFKRFYRSKNTSDSQGIGLGLPLAKAIVEGQGGILSVQSERLQGTTFTLSFLTES